MPSKPKAVAKSPVEEWRASLTVKERELHDLAAVLLKKSIVPPPGVADNDNGSYFPDRCHAFKAWLKAQKS